MLPTDFVDETQARAAFIANCTLRYLRLDAIERWSTGTQYSHMQGWWDESGDKPLWERAPCVVYPVVNIAARSNVDLCLGEGRFPVFTSKPGEDEGEEDGGLNDDDSSTLDRFIRELHKVSKFKAHSRDSFYSAQVCGSACTIHGVRNGKPFADRVPAKWCQPEFDAQGAVTKLEIRYPYIEEYKKGGKWAKRTKLYRRVIDSQRDVEYHPADANEQGTEPQWRENKDRSVTHDLGFCPVTWYALMKGCTTVNVIDGQPIHANLTNEIHQHDIARSQWHRGALMSEPQIIEIGVPRGYSPTALGRTPVGAYGTPDGGENLKELNKAGKVPDSAYVEFQDHYGKGGFQARKKGPGFAWQYENKDVIVDVLNYPEGALKAQEDNCRDLRIKLQEALCVVFLDPENIKFAATTSGKALIAIKQKQIDRCDQFRDDLSEGFFEPAVSMQLRIAQVMLARGVKLKVAGANKVKPILDRLLSTDATGQPDWQMPALRVEYGPYFRPSPEEEQQIVTLVQKALGATKEGGAQLITTEIAIRRLAKVFGIENVQAVMDELEKLRQQRAQEAADAAKTTAETPAGDQPAPTPKPTPQAA